MTFFTLTHWHAGAVPKSLGNLCLLVLVVTTGAEGHIRITLAFANPRWIYTTEKTAP